MGFATVFIFGGISTFIVSTFFCFMEINPFYRFYYLFAWYSYIFFIDGIIYMLKKESLIVSRTNDFLFLLLISISFWFIFEIFNILLKNWSYIMLPFDTKLRYLGYIFSYATVLPAIFQTAEFLETIGIFKNSKIKKINLLKDNKLKFLLSSGLISFLLSIILPKIFFPLVWISLIFVFEYFNIINENDSLFSDLNEGRGDRIYTIFTAGMICGFMWELFNWKAGAKWIYHIPYLNSPKLFEMPLAGYLGFGFFALECYSFYLLIINMKRKTKPLVFYSLILISTIIITLTTIPLIDKYTVRIFTIQ